MDWAFWTTGALLGASGLALLTWALLWDRSRGRRRCPKCWYDMTGVPGLQCPECGKTTAAENKFFKTRRRWRWVILACVLLVTGGGTAGTPKLGRDGPFALVPTPALNWIASHFDQQADELYERLAATPFVFHRRRTRLTAWERVLIATGSARRLHKITIVHPDMNLLGVMNGWMWAALHAENEVRLIAPTIRHWVADADHPLSSESMLVSGLLARLTRPLPGVAEEIERRVERALHQGDPPLSESLWALVANDPTGRRTIPLALRVLHNDVSPNWRSDAIAALAYLMGRDERALDAIVDAVNDHTEMSQGQFREADGTLRGGRVCDHALATLKNAGASAAPAISRLDQLAKEHPELRDQIEQTIASIRADMETGN